MNAKIILTKAKKHLPQILSVTACIGVGAVAVLSGHDILKASKLISKKKTETGLEKLSTIETVKATWKCYIPTAIATSVTMGALIAGQKISAGQLASMTAACGYMAMSRKQAETAAGDENGRDIVKKTLTESSNVLSTPWAEPTGRGEELCFDAYSGRWFLSNKDAVVSALNNFQDYCQKNEYVSYNDIYSLLGISGSYFGETYGWCFDEDEGTHPDSIEFAYDYMEIERGDETVRAFVFWFDNTYSHPYDWYMEI